MTIYKELFPLFLPIFCGEPHHKRIFPPIGARGVVFRRSVVYIRRKQGKKTLCLNAFVAKSQKRHPKG
ncbi:hypothetical protein RT99_05290 [Flavobacterium sp. MEB061]|nr:hypothetical protein RT99_05290 [Flavobacterium sp. MEB061]